MLFCYNRITESNFLSSIYKGFYVDILGFQICPTYIHKVNILKGKNMLTAVSRKTTLSMLFILLMFVVFVFLVYQYLPVDVDWKPDGPWNIGVDWKGTFHPSTHALLRGENPHQYGLQNPAWVLFPLLPIALLPKELGAAVIYVLTFCGYGYVAFRLRKKIWAATALIFSPFVIGNASTGNIDWLVVIGLVLPRPIGLFLLLLKPQLTAGILLLWLIEAWQKGKAAEVFRVFGPVTLALGIEMALFGLWPVTNVGVRLADPYNASFFPFSLFIGIPLLWKALKDKNEKLAITASPFLPPYLTMHGFGVALLGLDDVPLLIAVVGYWIASFIGEI